METISEWIEDYYEEHGFSIETTKAIIRDLEEVLLEHALNAKIVYVDENSYD